MFFGLIATSGLRFSKAADLLRTEVELVAGVVTIRETKFGKSRVSLFTGRPRKSFATTPMSGIAAQYARMGGERGGSGNSGVAGVWRRDAASQAVKET